LKNAAAKKPLEAERHRRPSIARPRQQALVGGHLSGCVAGGAEREAMAGADWRLAAWPPAGFLIFLHARF
jgi:hypothetical protein